MSQTSKRESPEGRSVLPREAALGVPWMISGKVILFGIYFAISILTVRTLGPERYGVFGICNNILGYCVILAGLGLNAALLRFIPQLAMESNRAGMIRLLVKSAALQSAAGACIVVLLALGEPWINRLFRADMTGLMLLVGLLAWGQQGKDFLNDTFTALFRSRLVTLVALGQSILWIALILAAARWRPTVDAILAAQIASLFLFNAIGAWLLVRHFRSLRWRSPPMGVGRARVLRLAAGSYLNSMARALMQRYSEVFFLGISFPPAVVGVYELGCSAPLLAITFIPMAVQTLFSAGFAQAYSRDPSCLPQLVAAVYRVLILLSVPLAVFGLVFAPRAVVLIYGPEMAGAAPVAAVFCVLHLMPLLSLPLSMAITAMERIHNMLPWMGLQVALNLGLDALLIPRFGIPGAVAAVALTFLLTIPLRLGAVRRILGGIHFPAAFLVRTLVACVPAAFALAPLGPRLNAATLFAAGFAYLALTAMLLRLARVLRPEDVADLRALGFSRFNRLLDWITGAQRA